MEDTRLERAKAIAEAGKVRQISDTKWMVLSQTGAKKRYEVDSRQQTCTCPDFEAWELPCKHIFATRIFQGLDPITRKERHHNEENSMPRPTYPQGDWSAYNQAQIFEQEHFDFLLKDLCSTIEQPRQQHGRPRLPLDDVIFAAATKVYSEKSGRRASTEIREAKKDGFIDEAPHHNSISRYLLMPEVTPHLLGLIKESAAALSVVETQFAADATGFSTCVYDRWFDHKYGQSTKRQRWLKCHAMVGTRTNVVTAVEITEEAVSDTSMLPELLAATSENFSMKEVSCDKGYLSARNLMAIEAHGAAPYVPFKSNSTKGETSAWQKMWHMFWFRRDEFLQRYHRRSNVESTFSMIKRKFGGSVRSKKFESQLNEVLLKILCHNIVVVIHEMYALGIDPRFASEKAKELH